MAGSPVTPFDLTTITSAPETDSIMVFRDGGENDITLLNFLTSVRTIADANPTSVRLATLDGSGILNVSQLPAGYDDSAPIGEWAIDNTDPVLSDSGGSTGDKYRIVASGTIAQGSGTLSINGQSVNAGDLMVKGSSAWYIAPKVANHFDGSTDEDSAADLGDYYRTGDVNDRTNARQAANGVYNNGASGYLSLSDSALLEGGDGTTDSPCGESAIIEIDDLSSDFHISSKLTGSAPNNERAWRVTSAGKLNIRLYDSSTAIYIGSTGNTTLVTGKKYFVAWAYDGSGSDTGITLVVNEIKQTHTADSAGSYTAMHATSATPYLLRNSSSYSKGILHSYAFWDRELSVTELQALNANGNTPAVADQWGGAGNVFSGDSTSFASSLGNWIEWGSTSITVQQAGGKGQITNTASSTGNRGLTNPTNTFAQYQRYRLTFKCRCSSGTGQALRVRGVSGGAFKEISKAQNGTTTSNYFNFTPTGSELTYSCEIIGDHTSADAIVFDCFNNTGAGEVYDIDDIVLEPTGAVVALLPENIESDGSIVDVSSNGLNATATNVTPLRTKPQVSGSFTPQLYFGASLQTVSIAAGTWYKDANNPKLISFSIRIESPSAVSDAGNVVVSGLPFNAVNDAAKRFVVQALILNATGLGSAISALSIANTDDINLYETGATGITPITNANCTTSTILTLSGFYEIA